MLCYDGVNNVDKIYLMQNNSFTWFYFYFTKRLFCYCMTKRLQKVDCISLKKLVTRAGPNCLFCNIKLMARRIDALQWIFS